MQNEEEALQKPTPEDFFRSAPEEIVKLPIFEDEDGIFYAFGHVDPIEMTLAVMTLADYNESSEPGMQVNSEDMQYWYAKIVTVDDTDPNWDDEVTFTICKPAEEGAFPVTVWNY